MKFKIVFSDLTLSDSDTQYKLITVRNAFFQDLFFTRRRWDRVLVLLNIMGR